MLIFNHHSQLNGKYYKNMRGNTKLSFLESIRFMDNYNLVKLKIKTYLIKEQQDT